MTKLTKKQREKLNIEKTQLEEDLNLMLIQALGLTTDPMGYIVDDENGSRISFRKKDFKSNSPEFASAPFHKNDIAFDPFNDKKTIPLLFQKYINDSGIYTSTYATLTDQHAENKERLRVVTDCGVENSRPFHNPVYSYADYIFSHELAGIPTVSDDVATKLTRLDDINHELSME